MRSIRASASPTISPTSSWVVARLSLVIVALAIGCGRPDAAAPPVVRQIVTSDGVARRMEEAATVARPTIDEAAALTRAAEHMPPKTDRATARPRFAAISMTSDQAAWNFQARPVWLVTYPSAPFITENCACQGRPELAATVVAIDGATGALVIVYGLDAAG
jgi:hypothetical protein